jgi:hypothetical protein
MSNILVYVVAVICPPPLPPIRVGFKEYIERRHSEPFKFLFLTKMGLLGSHGKNLLFPNPVFLSKNVKFLG